jgi:hypothetical protein
MNKFLKDKKRLQLYTAVLLVAAAMPLTMTAATMYEATLLALEQDLIVMQYANDRAIQNENLHRLRMAEKNTAELIAMTQRSK